MYVEFDKDEIIEEIMRKINAKDEYLSPCCNKGFQFELVESLQFAFVDDEYNITDEKKGHLDSMGEYYCLTASCNGCNKEQVIGED